MDDYDETDLIIAPEFIDKLANHKIDSMLLDCRKFNDILLMFDDRDLDVKANLLKSLGIDDYDYFKRVSDKEVFMKIVFEDLLNDDLLNIKFQEFINIIWLLEKPQRDICLRFKDHEKVILNELNKKTEYELKSKQKLREYFGNKDVKKINIELDLERNKLSFNGDSLNNGFKMTPNNLICATPSVNSSINSNSNKLDVLLIYENHENKIDLVAKFKSKLNELKINYSDFNSIFYDSCESDSKNIIRDLFTRSTVVFILYDDEFARLFDEDLNRKNDCKYKLIGKLMYLEYVQKRIMNKRYYTFLINNCTNVKYYWLNNIHVKSKDPLQKSVISINQLNTENDNIEFETFLLNLFNTLL